MKILLLLLSSIFIYAHPLHCFSADHLGHELYWGVGCSLVEYNKLTPASLEQQRKTPDEDYALAVAKKQTEKTFTDSYDSESNNNRRKKTGKVFHCTYLNILDNYWSEHVSNGRFQVEDKFMADLKVGILSLIKTEVTSDPITSIVITLKVNPPESKPKKIEYLTANNKLELSPANTFITFKSEDNILNTPNIRVTLTNEYYKDLLLKKINRLQQEAKIVFGSTPSISAKISFYYQHSTEVYTFDVDQNELLQMAPSKPSMFKSLCHFILG